MKTLSIQLPDELYDEFINISSQLKISPDDCALLAISHLMQTDSFQNAMEAMERYQDGQKLIEIPEFQEELDVILRFHPLAKEELDTLDEESQVDILSELIDRTALDEEELEHTIDLVIKDNNDTQVVLSSFDFGDIIYEIGEDITIYHIALDDSEDEDEDDDEESDDDDNNDTEEDLDEEFEYEEIDESEEDDEEHNSKH